MGCKNGNLNNNNKNAEKEEIISAKNNTIEINDPSDNFFKEIGKFLVKKIFWSW